MHNDIYVLWMSVFTQSLQCKCEFPRSFKRLKRFKQSGFSFILSVETRHRRIFRRAALASVVSCTTGTLPTDFLGPRYIFPRIFPIPCLALICSNITKLPAGTSGRLSAILPLCSVVFFKKLTTDDRSDDNVFKSLDQPLVFKSILQILQKSLGIMLVSFSGVFIPGLLCCKLHVWPRSTRSTR